MNRELPAADGSTLEVEYMCDKNIVAMAYNHGGTRVITTNTEKIGRIAREMAEVQRDSYEALTENLAAAQRRSFRRTALGLPRSGSPTA